MISVSHACSHTVMFWYERLIAKWLLAEGDHTEQTREPPEKTGANNNTYIVVTFLVSYQKKRSSKHGFQKIFDTEI